MGRGEKLAEARSLIFTRVVDEQSHDLLAFNKNLSWLSKIFSTRVIGWWRSNGRSDSKKWLMILSNFVNTPYAAMSFWRYNITIDIIG